MHWLLSLLLGAGVGTGLAAADTPRLTVSLPGGAPIELLHVASQTYVAGMTPRHTAALEAILGGPFFADARTGPATEVTVEPGFWLARTELTQGQWRSLGHAVPWRPDDPRGDDLPALRVGRAAADAWIGRLNDAAGDSLYRLPTGAEWELAARAGAVTLWSFGDDLARLGEHAWYRGVDAAQPVAGRAANAWGFHDMLGNVAEWTSQARPADGIFADCGGVTRGGSYHAGSGHGFLNVLPFQRQPRDCGTDDLVDVGLRLVYRGPAPTAVLPSTWGGVKVRRPR